MLTTVVLFALASASALSCATLIAACILSAHTREEEPCEEASHWSICEVKLEVVPASASNAGFGTMYRASSAR